MTIKIAIIVGSTRPGHHGEVVGIPRKGGDVGRWVHDLASRREDAEFEIVDLAEIDLPMFDEPFTPLMARYTRPHTRTWSQIVDRFDGYVFVTPEYNHAPPAALKNAIDYLYAEWTNKAAGFVGYGAFGGTRAVEQLRSMMGELQIADVSAQVGLGLHTDFEGYQHLRPMPHQEEALTEMLDQLVAWSRALAPLRAQSPS
ncbi:NADPH-dependent FMN reductase [Actinomadura rudentiformis]|uniref:NAD(P)H-dependent oxidoreductase n=1 Tax=Actinomadura rudentiformis TaxID=359158 RepID=A0A6H9Z8J5_9ACTN|nr:NAD(P)H-dependent oxidoreductase [Actinomadura rudentiformis]KAB2350246.1 NAD(P)H-dependent oxidoreductase [Actinomadura rudentiformis]